MTISAPLSSQQSSTFVAFALAAAAVASALCGCGGGGGGGSTSGPAPPQAATTGVVIGSYFRNAKVCMDTNGNAICDAGETFAFTDGNGQFVLASQGGAIVAEIGTDAIEYDPDTNTATPVSSRIVFRAPREAPGVVSFFSTSVVSEMETSALSYDAAVQKVAGSRNIGAVKLLEDFNREADTGTKTAFKSGSAEGIKRIQLGLAYAKPGDDIRRILASASATLDKIKNVVVIYMENRSFNHLYGLFPGANGIANALATPSTYQQLDRDGVAVLPTLPPVRTATAAQAPTWAYVASLPNRPFRIDAPPSGAPAVDTSVVIPDLVHRYYQHQMQISGSKNNSFAAWSDAGGLTMGYYDGSVMKLWKLAQQFVLADNFFQAAFGGSFLNHFWLVCACSPNWPNPPASRISAVDPSGTRLTLAANSPASALAGLPVYVADLNITPRLSDGNYYAINTTQPPYQPSGTPPAAGGDSRLADPGGAGSAANIPLPALTARTVGDTLTAQRVDWKWYAGAWNEALTNRGAILNGTVPNFQPHHQPFNYFSRFDPTTTAGAAERTAHLRDYTNLVSDIQAGTLPPVAFYKPQGNLNQHPGYADVASGDAHVAELVGKLQAGSQWKNMLIVITYDEFGGFWDHVSPPKADPWGPGTRIPAIVISPYAKKAYVDSVPYDTTSIIKFVTRRFGLDPLPGARKDLGDLSNSLDLYQ